MADPMEVVCPACRKVNSSTRVKCKECGKDLAGATLASDQQPRRRRSSGIPFLIKLVAGLCVVGLAYFLVVAPIVRGTLVRDVAFTGSHAESFNVEGTTVTVTVTVDWSTGGGEITIEKEGETVARNKGQGSHTLETNLEPGKYEFIVVGDDEVDGQVRLWLRY